MLGLFPFRTKFTSFRGTINPRPQVSRNGSTLVSKTLTLPLDGLMLDPKEGSHSRTIVWLHGLGDCSEGFRTLFSQGICPNLPNTRVILPDAPEISLTANSGMPIRAWYDIYSLENLDQEDEEGIQESAKMINDILDEECKVTPSNRIVLGGFSQGGALANYVGLQYPAKLAGIVCCSGYILPKLFKNLDKITVNKDTPLVAYHGEQDYVVPYHWAKSTYEALEEKGIKFQLHIDPNQDHEIAQPQIDSLLETFKQMLKDQ